MSADTDTTTSTLLLRIAPDELRATVIAGPGATPDVQDVNVPLTGDTPSERLKALESAVYDHQRLLDRYARTYVTIDTRLVSVIPAQAAPQALPLLRLALPGEEVHEAVVCKPATDNAVVAVGLRREAAAFLRRTFPEAQLHHPLELLATYFSSRFTAGGNGRRIYVNVRRGVADILVLDRSELLHAVSYHHTGAAMDTAYYTFATLRTLRIDPMDVEVFVAGETAARNAVMGVLREYAAMVMPVIISPAMTGTMAADLPLDMKILPLCV